MKNQDEIIKKLIRHGFKPELISFELEIPLEQVIECKKKVERSEEITTANNFKAREVIKKMTTQAQTKMAKMRERYRQLYFGTQELETTKGRDLTQQESEFVESVIATIRATIEKISKLPKHERKKHVISIIDEIQKVLNLPLTIEMCEELYYLMESTELDNLNTLPTDKIDLIIRSQRAEIAEKFARAVETKANETNELGRLQYLYKKISLEITETYIVNPMILRLRRKIDKTQRKLAIERINDIPENILAIVEDITSETLDIQEANDIIYNEARRRTESSANSRFALTQEQQRRQILIQISKCLSERANQYVIKNPKYAISQLKQLIGGSADSAIRTVVQNLIYQKRFIEAKNLCKSIDGQYSLNTRGEIERAEIASAVMDALQNEKTPDEERANIAIIEQEIRSKRIQAKSIVLGKSQDGERIITLADIYEEQPIQIK